MSAVTTKGSAKFTIPATGGPGVHIIEVLHGELTVPYRNPEQNPAPGRPRFELAFTVTDGAPVLPQPPEQQAQKTVRVLPPQGELVSTPHSPASASRSWCSGSGLEPGKSYQLNWTRVVGNRMMGPGPRAGADQLGGIVQGGRRKQGRSVRTNRIPLRDAGRSRRHAWAVEDGAKKKSGTSLDQGDGVAAGCDAAGRSARHSPSISRASAGPRRPTSITSSTTTTTRATSAPSTARAM